MGFALKNLGSPRCAGIASELFTISPGQKDDGEIIGLCPFHSDSNPSFSYNSNKDVYYCQTCEVTGDLIKMWCHVNGHTNDKDGFKSFCRVFEIGDNRGAAQNQPVTRKNENNKAKKETLFIDETVWLRMQPLPESYIKRLIAVRGWSRAAIEQLDLRIQSVYLDKKTGDIKTVQRPDRIAIPVRDPETDKLVNIRVYKPGAKVGKIMSWGKGYGSAKLFPSNLGDGVIYLCEGEPDTICAVSNGLNAITQTSKLTNWPADHKEQFKGRDVVICYDADQRGQEFAQKAAKQLQSVAKSIKMLHWQSSMGCQFGYWPLDHGEDLTDFFVVHKKTVDDFHNLKKEAVEIKEKKKKAHGHYSDFFEISKRGSWTFKPRRLANRLMEDSDLLFDPVISRLYQYSGKFWEELRSAYLETRSLRLLGDEASSSRAADAANQARLLSIIPHGRDTNDTDLMCLENGMLDITNIVDGEVELKLHKKEYYATYQLPIEFSEDPEKDCPKWLQFLLDTVKTPEVIMQMQEFAGYCLTKETRYGKALVLLGPGSDGKSTFIYIIEQLVGELNSCSVSIKDLEDQFYRSNIYNKMLCTSTEISKDYFDSGFFKAIVTGDKISAAHKNQDPFEFEPFAKFIFAGNDLPRSRDNSDGFFRRIIPVKFKRQFFGSDEDTHLKEKLVEELPQILNWALAGLMRLIKNDSFTSSEETENLLLKYRIDNNPVMSFVESRCVIADDCQVSKDDLYRKYRDYCNQYNYSAKSRVHFFRDLSVAQKNLTMQRPTIEGKRTCVVDGIGLLQESSCLE